MEFSYTTEAKPGAMWVYFSGDLTERHQAETLLNEIQNCVKDGKNKFILDLSQLRYMNSSGINILLNVLTKSRNAGGETVITNLPRRIKDLMVITKLNTVFKVANNSNEAEELIGS